MQVSVVIDRDIGTTSRARGGQGHVAVVVVRAVIILNLLPFLLRFGLVATNHQHLIVGQLQFRPQLINSKDLRYG